MGTHGLGPPISGNPPTGQNGWFYKTNIAEVPKIYAAHHSKFRNKVSSRKTGDGMFYGMLWQEKGCEARCESTSWYQSGSPHGPNDNWNSIIGAVTSGDVTDQLRRWPGQGAADVAVRDANDGRTVGEMRGSATLLSRWGFCFLGVWDIPSGKHTKSSGNYHLY